MRIIQYLGLQASRDTAGKEKRYWTEESAWPRTMDGYQRGVGGELSIAAATTHALTFGDVDAPKGLYLDLDGDCVVRLNGSSDDIALIANTGADNSTRARLMIDATITAVEIDAPAGGAITGSYFVWGDPTS